VSAGLPGLLRDDDFVGRLGGDEFVAVISGPDAEKHAVGFADKLLAFLGPPFDLGGRFASVGASIGIAANGARKLDARELMRRADVAMYKAKTGGKNRHCVFSLLLDAERLDDLAVAGELRAIIDEGRIEIAYQPIVDAHTSAIVMVEALARWPSSSARPWSPPWPCLPARGLLRPTRCPRGTMAR